MFLIKTNDSRIKSPVTMANEYYQSEDFKKDVLAIKKYEFASCSPEEIFKAFTESQKEVEVFCYNFGFFRGRGVYGMTESDSACNVNSRYLNRTLGSLTNTIVHEVAHVIDNRFSNLYWGHGDNSANGKWMTFTYYIGNCAEKWVDAQVAKSLLASQSREAKRLNAVYELQRILA